MKCPQCDAPTRVIDSRETGEGCCIRRRRLCENEHRFSTTEWPGIREDYELTVAAEYFTQLANEAWEKVAQRGMKKDG